MELVPRGNLFFLFKNSRRYTLRKREKAHVLDEKSIPASKIEGNGHLYSTLGSFLVPTQFLAPMAASKIRPRALPPPFRGSISRRN
jgi:hypothetical protein